MSAAEELELYGDERDFPFDESTRKLSRTEFNQQLALVTGFDRLRFVDGPRDYRQQIYEFIELSVERQPQISLEIQRQKQEAAERKARAVVAGALRGKYGPNVQKVAEEVNSVSSVTGLRPTSDAVYREVVRAISEAKHGSEPTDGWDEMAPPTPEEPPF